MPSRSLCRVQSVHGGHGRVGAELAVRCLSSGVQQASAVVYCTYSTVDATPAMRLSPKHMGARHTTSTDRRTASPRRLGA